MIVSSITSTVVSFTNSTLKLLLNNSKAQESRSPDKNGDITLIRPIICAVTENFHDYTIHLDMELWNLINK